MDWKRYYVGVSKCPMRLFIGTGDIKKDGTIRYTNKSDDRSFEIINAVGKYMRIKLDSRDRSAKKKKNFFGYDLPRCGKLVLIRPGFDFQVYRHKDDAPERPLMDYQ